MPEIIVKQDNMTNVKVYPVRSLENKDFIAIKQDNDTIYIEKSKAIELQKAINQLK